VNAVCITQTFACASWVLCEFSGQCEATSLNEGAKYYFDLTLFLLRDFIQRQLSQETNYRITAKTTVVDVFLLLRIDYYKVYALFIDTYSLI
jgi:hypothetical protein